MAGELPTPLKFHPSAIHRWQNGYIAIGIDGELLKLTSNLESIGEVKKPFPTPIYSSAIVEDQLILTWVDHELLLARMSAINLNSELQNGPERGDLRTRREVNTALHPAGTVWSHILDSEPLTLCSSNEYFTFVLWKKGIYSMGKDAGEHWRKEEPKWPELERLPSAQTVISSSIQGDEVHLWSRGGGHAVYGLLNGEIRSTNLTSFKGILEHVFTHDKNHLLCYDSGDALWIQDGIHVQQKRLNGPIQHALWDEEREAWHIGGWREEGMLSRENYEGQKLQEIPVQILHHLNQRLILLNNGSFRSSVFQPMNTDDDE